MHNLINERIGAVFGCIYTVLFVASHIQVGESKQFTKCELTTVLRTKYGLEPVAEWVCIAEQESQFSTTFRDNGTNKFGLFGIDTKSWCNTEEDGVNSVPIGNRCGIDCKGLLDDAISDDVECAKQIHTLKGFQNWEEAYLACLSKNPVEYLNDCETESDHGADKSRNNMRISRQLKAEDISISNKSLTSNDCCTRIIRDDELDKIEMEFGGAVLRVIEIEKTVQVVEKAITDHIEKHDKRVEALELQQMETEAKLEGSVNELELIRKQLAEFMQQLQNVVVQHQPQPFFQPPKAGAAAAGPVSTPAPPVLGLGSLLKNILQVKQQPFHHN